MTDELTRPNMKAALIALVERGQVDEEAFRAALSAEERAQVGTAERWAPKEVVAHLGFWKRRQADRLRAMARGETPPDLASWETLNTESWPEHARLTWDESVARSDVATRDLIAALEALPPEMLNDGEARELTDRIVNSTIGNASGHVSIHMSDYYLSHGEVNRAKRVNQDALDAVIAANLGDSAVGSGHYNLACFCAANGLTADALSELQQAFALRPDLGAWARDDHDLDSLRADPAFQALFPQAPAEGA